MAVSKISEESVFICFEFQSYSVSRILAGLIFTYRLTNSLIQISLRNLQFSYLKSTRKCEISKDGLKNLCFQIKVIFRSRINFYKFTCVKTYNSFFKPPNLV
jgi:hypothetical protein